MKQSKGFDFSDFRSLPVERTFELREGVSFDLKLNLDLLTVEKMDALEAEAERLFSEAFGMLQSVEDVELPEGADESAEGSKPPAKVPTPKLSLSLFASKRAMFQFFATALAGGPGNTDPFDRLIHDWSVVDPKTKKPVPISYETFLQMPPEMLRRLFQFCVGGAANPTDSEKKVSADI